MRQELGVNVACLGDLQGPKFRVGELLGSQKDDKRWLVTTW